MSQRQKFQAFLHVLLKSIIYSCHKIVYPLVLYRPSRHHFSKINPREDNTDVYIGRIRPLCLKFLTVKKKAAWWSFDDKTTFLKIGKHQPNHQFTVLRDIDLLYIYMIYSFKAEYLVTERNIYSKLIEKSSREIRLKIQFGVVTYMDFMYTQIDLDKQQTKTQWQIQSQQTNVQAAAVRRREGSGRRGVQSGLAERPGGTTEKPLTYQKMLGLGTWALPASRYDYFEVSVQSIRQIFEGGGVSY